MSNLSITILPCAPRIQSLVQLLLSFYRRWRCLSARKKKKMSPVRNTTTNDSSGSGMGSHVDAPQKPNYRSPVQGLEWQGIWMHLPSCSSVCADLWDRNTHTCGQIVLLFVILSYIRDRSSCPFNLSSQEGKGKGKGLACSYSRDEHLKCLTRSWNSRG
jgi:hypothetical protein